MPKLLLAVFLMACTPVHPAEPRPQPMLHTNPFPSVVTDKDGNIYCVGMGYKYGHAFKLYAVESESECEAIK